VFVVVKKRLMTRKSYLLEYRERRRVIEGSSKRGRKEEDGHAVALFFEAWTLPIPSFHL
jgi:hypothetical protein